MKVEKTVIVDEYYSSWRVVLFNPEGDIIGSALFSSLSRAEAKVLAEEYTKYIKEKK